MSLVALDIPARAPCRRGWFSKLVLAAAGAVLALPMALPGAAMSQSGDADPSAVILIYHRFAEGRLPATNIDKEQFSAQLEELAKSDYTVVPISRVIEALETGEPLPEKAVAITVDDAYSSFAETGWPMFKEHGFPVSLFVATDAVDAGYKGILSWDEIRRLKSEGVEIGHHGAGHIHMVDAGMEASRRDVEKASRRFESELGEVPDIFAFPYGEYSRDLADMIEEMGFRGALAQYSSVAAEQEGLFSLPRFPINERYGDIQDFRLKVNAMALPVKDIVPRDPVIEAGESNPPAFGYTMRRAVDAPGSIACYPSHTGGRADIKRLSGNRVEVRVDKPFPPGRSRINCTLRHRSGRWFWLGKFFYVPGSPSD